MLGPIVDFGSWESTLLSTDPEVQEQVVRLAEDAAADQGILAVVLSLPREKGGWGFPCVDGTPALLQLKTMLMILHEAENPARSLALYFVGQSRRDLGIDLTGPSGACAETPPPAYSKALQLYRRLVEQAPQLDITTTPASRLAQTLLEPQLTPVQIGLSDSFPWAIQALGADDKELSECWEIIKERREAAKAKEEREAEERRREASELKAKEEREAAVEMKRLELEMKRLEMNQAVRGVSNPGEVKALKIKDLMQPFKVVARLSPEEAADYDAVKLGLQKKYRLSTEAFRQRFRGARKKPEESYIEFAYNLRSNLVEWLKSAEVYGNHDGIVECFGLEQLYKGMPEVMRYWVQDKNPDTTQKAAELAEEFVARRSSQKDDTPERKFPGARGDYRGKYYKPRSEEDKREPKDSETGAHRSRAAGGGEAGEENHRAEKQGRADETTKKQFEARKPMRCFRCNETGHMAAGCRKPRVVFSYLSKDDENDRLLEPYLHDLLVNGEPCKVLRDCAATLDVVHPSLVQADHYTDTVQFHRTYKVCSAQQDHPNIMPGGSARSSALSCGGKYGFTERASVCLLAVGILAVAKGDDTGPSWMQQVGRRNSCGRLMYHS
ncbi:axoneme-associated protein mst101(2)-like [Ixodes scapularis]